MNNLDKINKLLETENLTEEAKNEVRNRFFLIIENDEIKTASDAYEFGRIWQSNCFEVNADWQDYADTTEYIEKLYKRFYDDTNLRETFEDEFGMPLND